MRLYQTSTQQEQDRILITFKSGYAMCKAALLTFLHAIIMLTLFIVHIMTFMINFAIGTLIIAHAIICMIRLILVQLQDLTENPMNTVERGNER